MYRKFIATVTAAAIALTALGTLPAAADQNQAAKTIAAILGIAVVGKLIHDRNKDRKEVHHVRPNPVHPKPQHPVRQKPLAQKPAYEPPRWNQPTPRPLPERVHHKVLPRECFRSFNTFDGKVRMFPRRCLKRNFDFADRLPRKCLYVFETDRGERRGYEARCMRDRGYRLARG